MSREENIQYLKKYLDSDKLESGIKRLNNGEPVQYIIGDVDFYGNKILVNKNVLIPRFETELLVEKSVKYINKLFDRCVDIIDIGTGSGCIAISISKLVSARVSASDISEDALDVARENAKINKADINFRQSDVFNDIDGIYDVIISNPPYIRMDEEIEDIVKNNEPNNALYAVDDGLYFYNEILSNCSRYLREKYLICFEIGMEQGEQIKEIANKYLKNINISIEKDYNKRDRYVFIWNGEME